MGAAKKRAQAIADGEDVRADVKAMTPEEAAEHRREKARLRKQKQRANKKAGVTPKTEAEERAELDALLLAMDAASK